MKTYNWKTQRGASISLTADSKKIESLTLNGKEVEGKYKMMYNSNVANQVILSADGKPAGTLILTDSVREAIFAAEIAEEEKVLQAENAELIDYCESHDRVVNAMSY